MAVNKVIYNSTTLIDISADTVTADTLLSGYTAHGKDGTSVTGTLEVQTIYVGSTDPSSSLGSNGDIYLKVGG